VSVEDRTALCLECRTALSPNERCDAHPRAAVVNLADPQQRGRAIHTVWGPPHVRARQAATAGGVGGGLGGIFEGCGACDLGGGLDGEAALVVIGIVIVAFAAILIYYLVKRIVHWVRVYRARPRPTGSAWKPPQPRKTLRGKVRDAVGLQAPLTFTACAAWGVVFSHDRAVNGRVTLRDGATAGLTIETDDGRTVTIPAGRVRLEGDGGRESVDEAYLRRIDREYADNAASPIPYDEAREVRLAVGDAVEITGGLEERFDPNAAAGYREAAATMLVVAGVPTLRVS
jgi:hypothetical protein